MPVDPIPRPRSIMDATTSGELLVGNYGGGTANVEFQLLTGMRNEVFAPQLGVPFQQLVPEDERFPSLVPWFAARGHDDRSPSTPSPARCTDVARPTRGSGSRSFVEESDLDDRPTTGRHGKYVDDTAAFDEVLARLRESPGPALRQPGDDAEPPAL